MGKKLGEETTKSNECREVKDFSDEVPFQFGLKE